MKESFNSALKISGLLSLGGVMIAGLFGAVVVPFVSDPHCCFLRISNSFP